MALCAALLLGVALAWQGVNAYASYRVAQQAKALLADMGWQYGIKNDIGDGARDGAEGGLEGNAHNPVQIPVQNRVQWQSLRASVLGRLSVKGLQIRLAPAEQGEGLEAPNRMDATRWQLERLHIHQWAASERTLSLHASMQGLSVAGGQSPLSMWEKEWLPADAAALPPTTWQPLNTDAVLQLDADANHAQLVWSLQQPGQQGMALQVKLGLTNIANLWAYVQTHDVAAQWGALQPWQVDTLWALLGQARLQHFSVHWVDEGAAQRWVGAWRQTRQLQDVPAWLTDLQWCGADGAAWRDWWLAAPEHCQALAHFLRVADAASPASPASPLPANTRELHLRAATQAQPALAVLWQAFVVDPQRLPALLGWQVQSP